MHVFVVSVCMCGCVGGVWGIQLCLCIIFKVLYIFYYLVIKVWCVHPSQWDRALKSWPLLLLLLVPTAKALKTHFNTLCSTPNRYWKCKFHSNQFNILLPGSWQTHKCTQLLCLSLSTPPPPPPPPPPVSVLTRRVVLWEKSAAWEEAVLTRGMVLALGKKFIHKNEECCFRKSHLSHLNINNNRGGLRWEVHWQEWRVLLQEKQS